MIKKIIQIPIIVALFVTPLVAQSGGEESRVGTTAAPFLTLGVGAKGHALGHANTINVSGAEAIFWNPAGMAIQNKGDSFSSSFISITEYFADVDIYGTGIVVPIGKNKGQSLGIGLHFVDYGRMDVTTVELQDGTGATFGAHDLSIGVSYAQKLTDSFHFGGSVKLIQQKIYDMSAEAFAVDLGFLLKTNYLNGLTIGASITNFGRDMQMSGINSETYVDLDPTSEGNNEGIIGNIKLDNWELPLSFKFGLMAPAIKTKNLELLLMSEVQQTNDNKLNIDSGAELSYISNTVKFHMRSGYKDLLLGNNVDSHFTYGIGLTLKTSTGIGIGVDFAQVPFEYLGQTSIIDVKLYY
ncbi:MAG: hypothetical protein CL669_05255 [Balneola sp.]|nr:hypothetical protein [Balneola sp.]|tara:strand:+ start:542 stop:1603 length:1062 start_codon:yes stop_codon:yes gene_type:complete